MGTWTTRLLTPLLLGLTSFNPQTTTTTDENSLLQPLPPHIPQTTPVINKTLEEKVELPNPSSITLDTTALRILERHFQECYWEAKYGFLPRDSPKIPDWYRTKQSYYGLSLRGTATLLEHLLPPMMEKENTAFNPKKQLKLHGEHNTTTHNVTIDILSIYDDTILIQYSDAVVPKGTNMCFSIDLYRPDKSAEKRVPKAGFHFPWGRWILSNKDEFEEEKAPQAEIAWRQLSKQLIEHYGIATFQADDTLLTQDYEYLPDKETFELELHSGRTNFDNVSMKGLNLSDINFQQHYQRFGPLSFKGADLRETTWEKAFLPRIDLTYARLAKTFFGESYMQGATIDQGEEQRFDKTIR